MPAPLRLIIFACAVLTLSSTGSDSAHAGFLSIIATTDGYAKDSGIDGTYEVLDTDSVFMLAGVDALVINEEWRALIEFNLAGLAPTDTITSVTFRFAANGSGVTDPPEVPIRMIGYGGDGILTVGDATIAGASVVPVQDFWPPGTLAKSVTIDPSFVQGLLGSVGFVGLRIETVTSTAFSYLRIVSLEEDLQNYAPHPTLDIEFESAVPEPGSLVLLGTFFGTLVVVSRRFRRNRLVANVAAH